MSDEKYALLHGRPAATIRTLLRQAGALLLTCSFVVLTGTNVLANSVCKPLLSFKNVREIHAGGTQMGLWSWKASIKAETNFCATRSGGFEIDFVRIKEYSADLQFTERFRWNEGQFDVSIELTPDESILEYRLGFVAPCVCREFPDIQ